MKRLWAAIFAAVAICVAASGARADDFVLENVAFASPIAAYRAARMEFTGSKLSRDETAKLLDADNRTDGADRFAMIAATRVHIPELVADTRAEGYAQTLTYREIAIGAIAQGVAQTIDIAGANFEMQRDGKTSRGSIGAMHAEGVDFPALVRIASTARSNAGEPKRTTVARLTVGASEIVGPEGDKIAIGRIEGERFSGRALAAPVQSLVDLSAKAGAKPMTPQASRAFATMLIDMASSFEVGSAVLDDFAISDASGSPVRIKRIALQGVADGKVASFALEGLEAGAPSRSLRVEKFMASGLDIGPALAAAATDKPAQAAPHFDRLEISGVAGATDGAPFGLERAAATAAGWRNLLPTKLSVEVAHATASLISAGAARSPALAALGYDKLDLSGAVETTFDATKGELTLDRLSLDSPGVGGAALTAMLSHVPAALFDGEAAGVAGAFATLAFWRADAHLADSGLIGRYLAAQARKTGKSEPQVRDELAGSARALVHSFFSAAPGADPRVEKVANAAAAFVQGGRTLDISAYAPDGIGVIDLTMAARLGALMDRVRIDAKAH